ncbi:MAG: glycosyltransferase family 2 protein [Kiritimatiellia bacterium]
MRDKISACITACDEDLNIRRCLESVKWADEIVVVDSFSKDRTVAICKEYTDRVYQHEWLGYIGQKNLIKDLAQGPWLLFIDADEEVSPALLEEIRSEFESGSNREFAGYMFPRMVYYLGKWIRHGEWYPDIKLRLFRKDKGTCAGHEPHDRTTVDGAVKLLRGHLHHYTYEDIFDQIKTMNQFSSIAARSMHDAGYPFLWRDLLFRPGWRLFKALVLKRGIRDGIRGIIIAMCSGFGVFMKYAKLMELYLEKPKSPAPSKMGELKKGGGNR